jgi:D-lactate dehydrogenase
MMALSRNMQLMIPRVNTGNYSLEGLVGSEVTGKVIGLIGTGKIAQEFAMLVKPMAAKILAYDPYPSPQAEALGVEYHDLSYVLKNSDVVSLHCPLTNDTMHTINRMTLRTMKKNCIIINTARGGLINTPDIIEALENGRIAGVAIDVYEGESELFFENRSDLSMEDRIERWDHNISRLIHLPNTIVSPHVAFLTKTALENIADTTVSNLSDSFSNIASANVVC